MQRCGDWMAPRIILLPGPDLLLASRPLGDGRLFVAGDIVLEITGFDVFEIIAVLP